MAEITRRRTGEMLRKLFENLIKHPDGMQAGEAIAALERDMQPTEYERGTYAGGGRRFSKIVRFATIDCVKAGWLLKNKGRWSITEAGNDAYKNYKDPEIFYRQAIKLYQEWKTSQPDASASTGDDTDIETVSETASITIEEAEEQAWREIEQYLKGMPPYEFQELVACLLRAMGYHVSWVAPPGKDGGIDILASQDPLGAQSPRIKVQVKRQGQAVTVDGLRSFMAMLHDADVGIFVSIGGFTKDAYELARTQEKRKVTLIDIDKLFELWVEYYDRLAGDGRKRFPLKKIHFLSPES
jgi:restriction system protein